MGGILKKIAAFIAAQKKYILTIGAGWSVDRALNFSFEWFVYPTVIRIYGLMVGGGVLILISIVSSLAMIWFYDKTKKDWLGIEKIKALRDTEGSNRTAKLISWLLKKGNIIALIGLSLISEPLKVTLYVRRGSNEYAGLRSWDWAYFLSSVCISNVSWALTITGGWKLFDKFF